VSVAPGPRAEAEDGLGALVLPRPPGVLRRFWRRHPRTADLLLVLFWAGPEVLATTIGSWQVAPDPVSRAIVLVLVLVAAAGIPVRRTHPRTTVVLGLVSIPAMVWTQAGYSPALFAVYVAGVYVSTRASWWAAAFAAVAGAGATALRVWVVAPGSGDWGTVLSLQLVAFLLVAVLVGINTGGRRRYEAALIDRAHQLARERDQQARLATAAERARIAREMHDVVSHSLTVMVRLAEGAEAGLAATTSGGAPGAPVPDDRVIASRDAVRAVADTGRGAMTDMRRMLGVLGDAGKGALAPQPGVADLPDLVVGFRAAGAPVVLELVGVPPADDALQLAVYRTVQEGLTNALRHASRAQSITATVTCTGATVTVEVVDDAPRRAPSGGSESGGRGLIGLRERTAALGGRLEAGPQDAGGWRLVAHFPIDGSAR